MHFINKIDFFRQGWKASIHQQIYIKIRHNMEIITEQFIQLSLINKFQQIVNDLGI